MKEGPGQSMDIVIEGGYGTIERGAPVLLGGSTRIHQKE